MHVYYKLDMYDILQLIIRVINSIAHKSNNAIKEWKPEDCEAIFITCHYNSAAQIVVQISKKQTK